MPPRSDRGALRTCAPADCRSWEPPGGAGVSCSTCRQRRYLPGGPRGGCVWRRVGRRHGGRLDEACVGDLVALEAQGAGLEGIVIWGLHRDTADIRAIGLPVFGLGTIPTGPQRLDARLPDALESATVGDWTVGRDDLVMGDDDG